MIGEVGILEELDLKGIKYMGGPEDAGKKVTLKKGEFMEHDAEVRGLPRGGLQNPCGALSSRRLQHRPPCARTLPALPWLACPHAPRLNPCVKCNS